MASEIYTPFFPISISLAIFSDVVFVVTGRSDGGFVSTCGTGFIVDSRFGYLTFDFNQKSQSLKRFFGSHPNMGTDNGRTFLSQYIQTINTALHCAQ